MGQKVLIIGQSGTGKSTSMRNFNRDEVCLIKTINKQLPFRGKFEETHVTDNAKEIISKMKSTDKKVIVVDDAQYLMCNEFFRRATETGWQKYTDIGKNFYDVLTATDGLADDVIVYFMLHVDKDDEGHVKIKTIGRMLDEKLTVEGTATIVLMSNVIDGNYTFQTQNSGKDICKSPMEMFKNFLIENDLKMVDGIIREYYELSDVKPEEKGVSIDKPSRGSRRERKVETPAEEVKVEEVKTEEEPKVEEATPVEEEAPKRTRTRTRTVETATVEPAAEVETTEEKPVRKTLAEKMAEGGFEVPERKVRTRSRVNN